MDNVGPLGRVLLCVCSGDVVIPSSVLNIRSVAMSGVPTLVHV